MKPARHIVMLGTDISTKGGISSVVNVYREEGLFERFPILYLSTHIDSSASRKIRFFITALLRYMAMLMRGKAAAAHVHISTGVSFWRKLFFVLPSFVAKVPVVLHLHGADFDRFYDEGSPLRRWIMRSVFDRADSVIVLSNSWKKWIEGISSNRFIISIYNPVRMPDAADFIRRDPSIVLFLGQLGTRKGAYDLVRAACKVMPRHREFKLVLAGDGEVEKVRAEVRRLDLDGYVEVLDWVSGRQKQALLENAAVYALPSYCEGLPMSVLEAMAAGLPVVSTPVGGIPEAVTDGKEGYVIAPGDIEALAGALDTLLSHPELRMRMGEAARRKIENTFSSVRVVPQIEGVYRRLGVQQCRP